MTSVRAESSGAGRPVTLSKSFPIEVPDVRELFHRRFSRESGFQNPLDPKFHAVLPSLMGVTDPHPKTTVILRLQHEDEMMKSPADIAAELKHLPAIHILQMRHALVRLRDHNGWPKGCRIALVRSNRAVEATELVAAFFDNRHGWTMEVLDQHCHKPRHFKEPWYMTPNRRPFAPTKLAS